MNFSLALLLISTLSVSDAFHCARGLGGNRCRVPFRTTCSRLTMISTDLSRSIVHNDDALIQSIGSWEYQHEYHPVYETASSVIPGGSAANNDQIARPALRLVQRLAKRLSRGQSEMEDDLIQEGLIAVMEAIQHYPLLNHKVMPLDRYVTSHVIAEMAKSMKGSLWFHEQKQQKRQRLDSQSRVMLMDLVMPEPFNQREEMTSTTLLRETSSQPWIRADSWIDQFDELTPESEALQSMVRSDVSTACDEVLNDMEREAIRLHFGLEQPGGPLSWREMAKRWKTTPQFVQSITEQALRKLRRHSVGDKWWQSS